MITLITPTGARQQAFDRCFAYVNRQDAEEKIQWIVVDDAAPVTTFPVPREGIEVLTVRPKPPWKPGANTLGRNLRAAFPWVKGKKVLFVEDDDWYAPDYVREMSLLLEKADVVGDPVSLYYNVPRRKYRTMLNSGVASLCQTGIRAEILPVLESVIKDGPTFIDGRFWQRMAVTARTLTPIGRVVGIKGLPGRPGIGIGHNVTAPSLRNALTWKDDAELSVLQEWVGMDINYYKEFLG